MSLTNLGPVTPFVNGTHVLFYLIVRSVSILNFLFIAIRSFSKNRKLFLVHGHYKVAISA